MTNAPAICLVGDIVVDVTLQTDTSPIKVRHGGIVHAARALWALGIPYDVAYFSPAYLDEKIADFLSHHGCVNTFKLGNISGAPYIFLVGEAKEIGLQGYEFLLRDEIKLEYDKVGIQRLVNNNYEDHLLISGNYDLTNMINSLKGKVHVDVANNVRDIDDLSQLQRKIDTLFLSTSSDIFFKYFKGNFMNYIRKFEKFANEVILKENRGGSRGFNFAEEKFFHTGSQPRKISHSVGVGDAFDATYVAGVKLAGNEQIKRLTLSSWIAAEYAETSFPDDFKRGAQHVLKSKLDDLVAMGGVSLPWEKRDRINIYLAAPDFSFVDVSLIDKVEEALKYHNFRPRRPIKENGEMENGASKERKVELVARDLQLFEECALVLVVLLYDDPGTFIEIGYAVAKGKPVIVYDPRGTASNCMLTELPILLSNDMDEIITEVFVQGHKL